MYLARFSYDVAPANRQQALKSMYQELEAARKKWKSGMYPAEDAEPAHERVWGPRPPLEKLMGPVPPGEESDGETTRFGALAARLWLPLLRCERSL